MAAIDAYANFAFSKVFLAPAPSTTGTSITLSAGTGGRLPPVPFNAAVWPPLEYPDPANAEIVRVTARTGDQLTIVRAQEGTVARAVAVGDAFAATITKKTLDDLRDASNLNTGTIPLARMPAGVPSLTVDNHWTGAQYVDAAQQVVFTDPGRPAGTQRWRIIPSGGNLYFQTINETTGAAVANPIVLPHAGGVHVDALYIAGRRAVDLETIYPVGSLYFNASNGTNPAALFGFGTWVEFGPGRAVVCYNAAEAEFNAPEKTGGVKSHTLTQSEMPYHTHPQDPHAHPMYDPGHTHPVTDPGHNHPQNAHSHTITGVIQSTVSGVGRYEFEAIGTGPDVLAFTQATTPNASTNPFTATNIAQATNVAISPAATGVQTYPVTAVNQYAGGNVAHTNLQPFITCFIWKRTS